MPTEGYDFVIAAAVSERGCTLCDSCASFSPSENNEHLCNKRGCGHRETQHAACSRKQYKFGPTDTDSRNRCLSCGLDVVAHVEAEDVPCSRKQYKFPADQLDRRCGECGLYPSAHVEAEDVPCSRKQYKFPADQLDRRCGECGLYPSVHVEAEDVPCLLTQEQFLQAPPHLVPNGRCAECGLGVSAHASCPAKRTRDEDDQLVLERDQFRQRSEHTYFSPLTDVFTINRGIVAFEPTRPLANSFVRSRLPSVYSDVLHNSWQERKPHQPVDVRSPGRSSSKAKGHCAALFAGGERAHLCCRSVNGDAVYERLVHVVLGGEDADWGVQKRASAYRGSWNAEESKREARSGLKHHVRNLLKVHEHVSLMDREPQVVVLPVLDAFYVRAWNGEPYDAVVIAKDRDTWRNISVDYDLCREASSEQLARAVEAFNGLQQCVAVELSRSFGCFSAGSGEVELGNCEDDVLNTLNGAKPREGGHLRLPCVFLGRTPHDVRVCLRRLGDGSDNCVVPDPMLLLFKSISMLQHWSGFEREDRKPFLPGCAEPERVCSQCEASWEHSEEVAAMREAEEREAVAAKLGLDVAPRGGNGACERVMLWDAGELSAELVPCGAS